MTEKMTIELVDGAQMKARIGDHEVLLDLPERLGGKGQAPTPSEFFLLSLGACKLFYAYQFLARRGVATDGGTAVVEVETGDSAYEAVRITVTLPGGVPDDLVEGTLKCMEACFVRKSVELPVKIEGVLG